MCQMLHSRWLEILQQHSIKEALWHTDIPSDTGCWTFSELDQQAQIIVEKISTSPLEVLTAHADQAYFIPTILAGWQTKTPIILLESKNSQPLPIHSPLPANTAIIKQTCGATGIERSLFLNSSQILAECQRNIDALGLHPDRRGLATISLAHSYGFGCLALPLLLGGIPLEVIPSPMPMLVQQSLAKSVDVFLPAVPTLWKTWWLTNTLKDAPISLALSAGAPLCLELETNIWEGTGLKVHNFYGTSETGAIAYDDSSRPRKDAKLIGKVLPGVMVSICTDRRIGVQTDALVAGSDIWRSDQEFSSPSYRTMDFGEMKEGQLYWLGHIGAAINVAGRKVSPEKVQRICESIPGVLSATVSSVTSSDLERFEEVAIQVRLSSAVDLKSLKKQVYERLDSWEMPRHWTLTST